MFEADFQNLGEHARDALRAVVERVRALVPAVEEGRSYGVPALRYRGKPLLGFAATAQHLSLYPFSPAAVEAVRGRLDPRMVSKGTIRFTADEPLPPDVLTDLVRVRVAEIDG